MLTGIGIKLVSPVSRAITSGGVNPTLKITDHQELIWNFVSTNGNVAHHTISEVQIPAMPARRTVIAALIGRL